MPHAVQSLPEAARRAWMRWLTIHGPFWEDARLHRPDDFFQCRGEVVTDTAVGEAAFCCIHGSARGLVSFSPSDWVVPAVEVTWIRDDDCSIDVKVDNFWEPEPLEGWLQQNPAPVISWDSLETRVTTECQRLVFARDAFAKIKNHSFAPGAALRIQILLRTLDTLKGCFDSHGKRTERGNQIVADHFSGEKHWFSDSSDSEKNDFASELTFPHPIRRGEHLFCPWHGKVKTPQLRIHFSWPIRADEPTFVVYVGPKRTKR